MKIIIYTLPTCPWSDKALKFFKKKKMKVEERTLFKEEGHRFEIIEKSGQLGTPVLDIDGEIFTGFKEDKIKEFLKSKK